MANSGDLYEMRSAMFVETKIILTFRLNMISREKLQYNLEIITHDISIYTMEHPQCIVSNNRRNLLFHKGIGMQEHMKESDMKEPIEQTQFFKANQQMMKL